MNTGDNEADFIQNSAVRAFKDRVPLWRSHLGKTQFGVGGGGCRRIKHRNKGSRVQGCEVGAESSLRNKASYHARRAKYHGLRDEDPGMSLAFRETHQITSRVRSGVPAVTVSKNRAFLPARDSGELGWAALMMRVAG